MAQPLTGHGALTLGKDSVLRDASQGAYRLRRYGKGQKLTIFLIPELVPKVPAGAGLQSSILNDLQSSSHRVFIEDS